MTLKISSKRQKSIYAPNFGGGQVDITSGRFVFSASEAYLIENGEVRLSKVPHLLATALSLCVIFPWSVMTLRLILVWSLWERWAKRAGLCRSTTLKLDKMTVGG